MENRNARGYEALAETFRIGPSVRATIKPGFSENSQTARAPSPEEITSQVAKLIASPQFQHSDAHRQLLLYLAQRAATSPGESIKEVELATSVFGLSLETFDPQLDSAVRVNVGRLRSRILDYYASAGVDDDVVLEIPKGVYCLIGHYSQRNEPVTPQASVEPTAEKPRRELLGKIYTFTRLRYVLKRSGYVALFLLGIALGSLGTYLRLHSTKDGVPAHVAQFWNSFYSRSQPIYAVFSNPRLAGILTRGGLHYYQDENTANNSEPINLGYAGAGDVSSIHELTRLFDRLQWNFGVESGARLSWDTAKDANLIFIGRPEQNPALHEIPRLREFYFKYNAGIINAHPQAGEASSYDYTFPYDYDYAVIAFIPGIRTPQNTVVLAGDTTWGSQAAVECMTNESCVTAILDKLQVKPGQKVPYFEAVLKVKVNNAVPVWNSILAVRHYSTDASSWQTPLPDER